MRRRIRNFIIHIGRPNSAIERISSSNTKPPLLTRIIKSVKLIIIVSIVFIAIVNKKIVEIIEKTLVGDFVEKEYFIIDT